MSGRPVHPQHRIDEHLKDGVEHEAIGNYSSTPTRFIWTPDANRTAHIYRMIITVQDDGVFTADTYGNRVILVNGITLTVRNVSDDSIVHDLTADHAIVSNAEWASHCYDADVKSWGNGDELLIVRWTFSRGGSPILLDDSMYLSIDLNDDFSTLVAHRFVLQGEYV